MRKWHKNICKIVKTRTLKEKVTMKWSLDNIKNWTSGKVLSNFRNEFDFIGTDTRADLSGKIFIALKGESYDAHDYLDQAVLKGATALIVHRIDSKFEILKEKVTVILVTDTLTALQDLAHHYRKTLKTTIIGITGSNGKTTTKEFTAEILRTHKKTHFNQGSFNNHWGVPLTILQIDVDAEFAVIEMGMNHLGEISKLVKIADPDIVVCTMVGTAHLGPMGSQANVAKAKSEIYLDSRENTIRIFNQDQDWTFDMMYPVAKKYPASRMLSFSEKNDKADVFMKIEEISMQEMKVSGAIAGKPGAATIPIFGKQNLTNVMAAATIAYACKVPLEKIWQGLQNCKASWGRNQLIKSNTGAEILFDGYNANPDSMQALLQNIPLLKISGKKIGVFGQMKELGKDSAAEHKKLGQSVGQTGFQEIYFIGEDYKHFSEGLAQTRHDGLVYIAYEYSPDLGAKLLKSVKPGDAVIIKGSRGAQTERFLEGL